MKKNRLLSRKMVTNVAAALLFFAGAASAWAGSTDLLGNSGPLDQLLNAPSAGAAPSALPDVTRLAPVTKFSANGRLTESLASGGCANNPLVTSLCSSSGSCANLTMTGQLVAAGLAKPTLDACFTIITATSSGACYNGLGIGTLTLANGKVVNIAFGGDFCAADENSATSTVYYSSNLTYVIEGGTGPYATETGVGNIAASNIFVLGGGTPAPGIGEIAINGNLSKN